MSSPKSILTSLLFISLSQPLWAATWYVDQSVSTSGDGSSWGNAFDDLQSALSNASSGDEIWVAAGTYVPSALADGSDARSASFALIDGVALYGGYPTGGGVRDPASHLTILSGDLNGDDGNSIYTDNAYHVLTAANVSAATHLEGFTITGGYADAGDGAEQDYGGGLLCIPYASPTITNCSFSGNSAELGGGAIANATSSSPIVTNCSFSGNQATYGGTIYNFISSSPIVTNCSFSGNSADLQGGAIYNYESSPNITNCSFSGNSASYQGGAISNHFHNNLSLTNCILWNNRANGSTTATSASLFNDSNSTASVTHCLIENWSQTDLSNRSGFTASNNLDGTDPANNPLFVAAIDFTAQMPTTAGNLRLQEGSPAIDGGEDAAYTAMNGPALDLTGGSRFQSSRIDLGAYESSFTATFPIGYRLWVESYGLQGNDKGTEANPDSDNNKNILEYAYGLNPVLSDSGDLVYSINPEFDLTATGSPVVYLAFTNTGVDHRILFVRRSDRDAAGLIYTPEFSHDLNTWEAIDMEATILDEENGLELVSVEFPSFMREGQKARFFHLLIEWTF